MKHRIRIDTIDPDHFRARVETEDGETVHTTEVATTAEVAWEDAARWCRRRKLDVEWSRT